MPTMPWPTANPRTTAGTVILRIPASATLNDVVGNALVGPVQDGDTVTVGAVVDNVFANGFE